MKNLILKPIIIFFLLAIHFNVIAQTEFLVKIDTQTGSLTIIDSLPEVQLIQMGPSSTTLDENGNRFIFCGKDKNGIEYLYSVDVNTGKILSNPGFSTNPYELHYDNSSNNLYGLYWDSSNSTEYLVLISLNTGGFSKIDSIPTIKWIKTPGHSTYDRNNHRFIFLGADSNFNSFLFSIDVNTGKIISKHPFSSIDPFWLQFDNKNNTLYGIHKDNSNILHLVSINMNTGSDSIINTMAMVSNVSIMPSFDTFDENNQYFIYKDVNNFLYSVDVNTGIIVYLTRLSFPSNKAIELKYDNLNNTLYGLYYGNIADAGILEYDNKNGNLYVYPNPTKSNIFLSFNKAANEKVSITNLLGEKAFETTTTASTTSIDMSKQPNGIYFVQVRDDEGFVVRKVVVQH